MVHSRGLLKGSQNSAETALMLLINYRVRDAFSLQLLRKILCLVPPTPIHLSEVTAVLCMRPEGRMIPTCPRIKSQAVEGRTYLGVDISALVMWKCGRQLFSLSQ